MSSTTPLAPDPAALLAVAPALYLVAPAGNPLAMSFVSDNCRALLGLPATAFTASSGFWSARIHAAERRAVLRELRRAAAGESIAPLRYRFEHGAGHMVVVEQHSRLARLGDDQPCLVSVCTVSGTTQPATATAPAARVGGGSEALDELAALAEAVARCDDRDALRSAVADAFRDIFAGDTGEVYVHDEQDGSLRAIAGWGEDYASGSRHPPEACLGLRSGAMHVNHGSPLDGLCDHVPPAAVGAYVCMPLRVDETVLGSLHVRFGTQTTHAPARLAHRLALAERVGALLAACLLQIRLRESLRLKAIRDPLTRLYNRRFFDETLGREIANARRRDGSVGLLLIDLDHFKAVNDRWGHAVGDRVLCAFAEHLAQQVRAADVACRYGGEEFAVIMPGIPRADAIARADALRRSLHGLRLPDLPPGALALTCSTGVAVARADALVAAELVEAADRALYRAKREGRDRVVAAPASNDATTADPA